MNKQYYVREGRRFVKTDVPSVVDHRGEYYNSDGSFSKEKRIDSVGVCVMQNPTECIICGFREYENVTPDKVSSILRVFPDWRLGEQEEMHVAVKFYQAQLNLRRGICCRIHLRVSNSNTNYDVSDGFFFFYSHLVSSDASCDVDDSYHVLRLFKTVKL